MWDLRRWLIVSMLGSCGLSGGLGGRSALGGESKAAEQLPYLYLNGGAASSVHDELTKRFAPPPGSERVPLQPRSFGAYLRHLPLLPPMTPVLLYNGQPKARQDVHAAVAALDVGQ